MAGHNMNRFFSHALLNMLALMGVALCGKTPARITARQMLLVRLYDQAQAPAGVVHAASDEASRLFRAAGIRISWEYPSSESPEDQGTDMTSAAFRQPDVRSYVVVRLMRREPTNIFAGALGYSLPFAHRGAHVSIFYDRVETQALGANAPTYVILGHSIAHEIGHVLLGSSEHTRGGLMQGRWSPETWRLASSGLLAFSREEAERMNAGLQRFQAPPLRVQQPNLSLYALQRSPD